MLTCGQDNTVRLWDVAKGSLLLKLAGPDGNQTMQAAFFTPSGSHVIAVTRDGTLRWWSATGSPMTSIDVGDRQVAALAVSPDGAAVATGGESGTIQLWNLTGN
jgi:WD40 repeat protein